MTRCGMAGRAGGRTAGRWRRRGRPGVLRSPPARRSGTAELARPIPATCSASATAALPQITPANVKNLELQWVFQARSLREVRGDAARRRRRDVHRPGAERRRGARCGDRPGVLDLLRTRRRRWRALCCGRVNRGLAILGDTLFMGDDRRPSDRARRQDRPADLEHRRRRAARSRLLAHARAAGRQGQGHRRHRPAANTASAASSPRSMPATGKEVWRFYTDSRARASRATRPGRGDSWKTGGGSIWVTGSYDPELEPDLLGHRQSRARLERRRSGPATTSTPTRSSRSTPTPAR